MAAGSGLVSAKGPSALWVVFTSAIRVLFATLLFTAGGMAVGLLLGIVGTIAWGAIRGSQLDMRDAYLHVAIPVAVAFGIVAFCGSIYLELRARRT